MTDDFGSETQPPAEEHEAEHAPSQEAQAHPDADVWADDQPPHDDFGATEETATASHETAAEHEGEEAAVADVRQSRSMLPIIAGIGGILVVGGLIYWQFGRSPASAPPSAMSMSAPTSAAAAPTSPLPMPPPPPSAAAANAPPGDITSLYKPAPATATPPAIPEPNLPPPSSAAAAMPSSGSPPMGMPSMPPQANPANPAPAETAGNLLNPPPPVAGANGGVNDTQQVARLNALSTRMDDIQKSIDQENKQFNQLSNMIAAQAPPTQPNQPAPPQAVPALDFRLNKIEETLAKLETDIATKTPSPSTTSATTVASAEPTVDVPHLARKTSSSATSSARHRHVIHKKTKTVRHKTSPSRPSRDVAHASPLPSSSSPWVLRAATPKEAWVSGDATSSDLRHVQVGDTLPGVGVVRSISQTGGGWQIIGSAGIVR